jgi:hypothetical protein
MLVSLFDGSKDCGKRTLRNSGRSGDGTAPGLIGM